MILHNFRIAFAIPSSNVNEMRETESPRRSSAAARSVPSDLSHLHGRTEGRTDGRRTSLLIALSPIPDTTEDTRGRAAQAQPGQAATERERERQAEEAELHFPLCCVLVRSYESRFQVLLLLRHRQRQREDHVCLSVCGSMSIRPVQDIALARSVGMS